MDQEVEATRLNEYLDEIERRVQAGVAVLDKEVPDWPTRIELLDFDITSECKCVLGLVYEEEYQEAKQLDPDDEDYCCEFCDGEEEGSPYDYGAEKLAGTDEYFHWARHHGFDSDYEMAVSAPGGRIYWHDLQAVWTEVIRQRQASDAVQSA